MTQTNGDKSYVVLNALFIIRSRSKTEEIEHADLRLLKQEKSIPTRYEAQKILLELEKKEHIEILRKEEDDYDENGRGWVVKLKG